MIVIVQYLQHINHTKLIRLHHLYFLGNIFPCGVFQIHEIFAFSEDEMIPVHPEMSLETRMFHVLLAISESATYRHFDSVTSEAESPGIVKSFGNYSLKKQILIG